MDGPRTLLLQTSSERAYFPWCFPNRGICKVPCHVPGRGWCICFAARKHRAPAGSGQLQTHTPPLRTVCTCRLAPTSFRIGQYRFDPQSQRLTEKHFFIRNESAVVQYDGGRRETLSVHWTPRRRACLAFLRMPVLDRVHLVWCAKCTHF